MHARTTNEIMRTLTPAQAGALAAALDDCRRVGDDSTVDQLEFVVLDQDIATGALADQFAYDLVHKFGRQVVVEGTYYGRTWSADGSKKITITVPANNA